ncbi:putative ankyrin repeat protein [Acanthamoeba polyphaga mimivirus]|uniref:Ankyrin repeat protein n=1 Tax=Acanthamoeba polyphaga mimivirus Kroon TaxID=3069720 RepID=A0A0G2YBS7_9VIRU|nr:putative ankyrin repeat protein [Acanthamoeba polyphaga mimivirus]AKI80501.1 putative ankyrin repeat protein [Acanthamoeba polyphaga mimivirus Kroon]
MYFHITYSNLDLNKTRDDDLGDFSIIPEEDIFGQFVTNILGPNENSLCEIEPDKICKNPLNNSIYTNNITIKNKYSLLDASIYEILLSKGITKYIDGLLLWAIDLNLLWLVELIYNYKPPINLKDREIYLSYNCDDINLVKYIVTRNDYFQLNLESLLDYVVDKEIILYLMDFVDTDKIIKYVIKNCSSEFFIDCIKGNTILTQEHIKLAIQNRKTPVLEYLINLGIEYDFNELMNNIKDFDMLKYMLEIGNILDKDSVDNIVSNIHTTEVIEYLMNLGYTINSELIISMFSDTLIVSENTDIVEFLKSINTKDSDLTVDFIEYLLEDNFEKAKQIMEYFPGANTVIDCNLFLKYAIMSEDISNIEYAINIGADLKKYYENILLTNNVTILDLYLNCGEINDIDNLVLKIIKCDCIKSIKYLVDNNYNIDLVDMFHIVIKKYYSNSIKNYICEQIINNNLLIPNLVETIINLFFDDYDVNWILKYNFEYQYKNNLDEIIMTIIMGDYDGAKNMIMNYNHTSDLKVLYAFILKEFPEDSSNKIDTIKFLLDINADNNEYIQSAFMLSVFYTPLLKYFVEEKQVDLIINSQNIVEYLIQNGYYDVFRYLYYNGFDMKNNEFDLKNNEFEIIDVQNSNNECAIMKLIKSIKNNTYQ